MTGLMFLSRNGVRLVGMLRGNRGAFGLPFGALSALGTEAVALSRSATRTRRPCFKTCRAALAGAAPDTLSCRHHVRQASRGSTKPTLAFIALDAISD